MTGESPRRWLVIGAGGSGKSTLSRRMGALLDLPVIHLDRHYWRTGWVEPDKDTWSVQVEELAGRNAWVMDGNYSGTLTQRLTRADAVVLLDLPPWLCAYRVLQRRMKSARSPRPDLPEGCPDQINLDFLHWIVSYRSRSLPKVLGRLAETPPRSMYRFQTSRQVARFTESLSYHGFSA